MKTKTKFLSLLFALFMFLVSIVTLGTAVTAHADEEDYYLTPDELAESYDYEEDIEEDLTSFYYFSDNSKSDYYFNYGFIRKLINRNPNIIYDELIYFENNIWTALQDSYIPLQIENAFIIFEARTPFPRSVKIDDGGIETDYQREMRYKNSEYGKLDELFSTWKGNNCKIMFVSETDESKYEKDNFNSFLQYVDIHVNFDVFTPFVYSVFEIMSKGVGWGDTVIVFDELMSQNWFYLDYFINFLIHEERDTLTNADPIEVINTLKIKVYFYNGAYTDHKGNSVNFRTVEEAFQEKEFAFIISGVEGMYNIDFLNLFQSRQGDKYIEFFVFNEQFKSVSFVPDGIKYCGISAQWAEFYFALIIRDFMLNQTMALHKYNVWRGYCLRTFKPIFSSSDGWIQTPQSSSYLDNYMVLPDIMNIEGFLAYLTSGV